MSNSAHKSVLENVFVLVLLGILVGALAGAGIGLIQKKSAVPAAAAGR